MNKRELEEIKELCKDLEHLKKRLEEITGNLQVSHATVKGSSKAFPYIERVITVCGIDRTSFDKAVSLTKRNVELKIDEIMVKIQQAQAYIDTVEDVDIRIVLQMRYINGLTWEQIERESGMSRITAIRKHRKWMNDIE